MSLQAQPQEQSTFETSKLIIEDHPYQFLPNLAAIYGDTCAVILQQLHWTIQRPWFEGERLLVQRYNDLTYIRIFPFMWFDTLEGITKHLAKSTFYRYRKSLEDCKALSVLSSLGDKNPNSSRRNDEASWYAIDHGIVRSHDAAYRTAFEEALDRRAAQRAQVQFHDKDAYWRPSKDEDVSKQLDSWRACLSEHCEDEESSTDVAAPKAKNWGGKREKKVEEVVESIQSQVETEPVSLEIETENAEFSDVKSSQSQVGNDSVSTDFESQVDSKIVSSWESSVSQVGNDVSANLGFTPYKQTLSLESNTDDTLQESASPEMSSADAESEVESKLILSGDNESKPETKLEPSPETQQIALPETALAPLPSPLPEPLASMSNQFYEIATNEYGLKCDEELAARIISRSPLATMSDAAVVRMIGPDHAEAGLDKPLFGEKKRALAADVPQLRWLLFTWPAHRAEVEDWAARKNRPVKMAGAFVTKWEEGTLPPRDWIAGKIGTMRAEIRAEITAEESERAREVWDGLGKPQRAVVTKVGAMRAAERGGGNYNDQKEREARERRELLLDAEWMAGLPELVEAETQSAVVPAPAAVEALEAATPTKYVPSASEMSRFQFHAAKLLPLVRRGEFDLDGAEDHAIGQWLYSPKQAAVIRELVEALLTAEQKQEAA